MTTKPISQILSDAADLIEKPGCWTQGTFARDKEGAGCPPLWEEARSWCLEGAVWKATGNFGFPTNQLQPVIELLGQGEVVAFNDCITTTQPEVVAMLRKAAEKAKGEEGEESKL